MRAPRRRVTSAAAGPPSHTHTHTHTLRPSRVDAGAGAQSPSMARKLGRKAARDGGVTPRGGCGAAFFDGDGETTPPTSRGGCGFFGGLVTP